MIKNISNKEYQSTPAISHSLLVKIRKEGIYPAFLDSCFNENRIEEVKDCFDLGNAYHTLVALPDIVNNLENYKEEWLKIKNESGKKDGCLKIELPETDWYIYDFGLKRSNKAYTDFVKNICLTGDDLVLNWEEFETACNMAKEMQNHPLFVFFKERCEVVGFEKSIFRDVLVYGKMIPFKVRPDLLVKTAEGYIIIDFKSTKASSYDEMERIGEYEGYDIQAKDYIDRVAEEFEVPASNIRFICMMQSKKFPKIIRAFEFNNDSLIEAETDIYKYSIDFFERLNNYKDVGEDAFIDLDVDVHTFKHYERKIEQDLKENY